MEKWSNTLGRAAGLPTLLSQGTGDAVGLSVCPLVCLSICSSVRHYIYLSLCQRPTVLLRACMSGCPAVLGHFHVFTCPSECQLFGLPGSAFA